jgi:hypothetical protein
MRYKSRLYNVDSFVNSNRKPLSRKTSSFTRFSIINVSQLEPVFPVKRLSMKSPFPRAFTETEDTVRQGVPYGRGKNSHMKSCAASVDNVARLDCKRRHKQHILCIGALNVRK